MSSPTVFPGEPARRPPDTIRLFPGGSVEVCIYNGKEDLETIKNGFIALAEKENVVKIWLQGLE